MSNSSISSSSVEVANLAWAKVSRFPTSRKSASILAELKESNSLAYNDVMCRIFGVVIYKASELPGAQANAKGFSVTVPAYSFDVDVAMFAVNYESEAKAQEGAIKLLELESRYLIRFASSSAIDELNASKAA